LEEKYIDYPR